MVRFFGKQVSLKKLAKMAKTDPAIGTFHKDLVSTAKKLGFSVIAKNGGTIEILRKYINGGLPVMVGWFAFNEDHFSVACGVTDKYVHLMDSYSRLKTGHRKLKIKRFKELWFDFDDEKNPMKKTYGWYMVINKK
jgi:hypothetical protein